MPDFRPIRLSSLLIARLSVIGVFVDLNFSVTIGAMKKILCRRIGPEFQNIPL